MAKGNHGQASKQKDAGTALDLRRGARAVLTQPGERIELPDNIQHPEAINAWEEYWSDPVSSVITVTDHAMLRRWVDAVQRYYELLEMADATPEVVAGGGFAANPLYKVALAIGNQIERMEIKLGIGPKNRASLGIQIVQAESASKEYNNNWGGDRTQPKKEPEPDPRFT